VVGDGHLPDAESGGAGADENLGVDERPHALEGDGQEHPAVEELEGAVDVAHAKLEDAADKLVPRPGVDPSRE